MSLNTAYSLQNNTSPGQPDCVKVHRAVGINELTRAA